jgi:DNA-binding cell septation regulator SpoVG
MQQYPRRPYGGAGRAQGPAPRRYPYPQQQQRDTAPPPAQTAQQQQRVPAITVAEIRPCERGSLRAFVAVRIGPLLVRDFRLIQQDGQAAWVSPPQRSWQDSSGATKYQALVDLPAEWRQALQNAVLTAWQEHERAGGLPA